MMTWRLLVSPCGRRIPCPKRATALNYLPFAEASTCRQSWIRLLATRFQRKREPEMLTSRLAKPGGVLTSGGEAGAC